MVPANPSSTAEQPRAHIAYLDGLRGLAALWVVLYHFVGFGVPNLASPIARFALSWLAYGQLAVAIFIVLSGYLLMMQLVDGELKGGLAGFARRRATRIVPPYWAALLLAVSLTLMSFHRVHYGTDLSPPDLVAHILLLHNWSPAYVKAISGPFWSVAVEWDIYFIFAVLLRPIWRRFGITTTVLLAFAIGFAPLCLLPTAQNLSWSSPWFLGLFALGMAGCVANNGESANVSDSRHRRAAILVTVIAAVALSAELAIMISHRAIAWLPDCLTGFLSIGLIVMCGRAVRRGKSCLAVRILTSRPAVGLAAFSYSLYLTHATFALKLHPIIEHFHPSPELRCLLGLVLETPVALAGSYLFYLAFERRHGKRHRALAM